MKTIKSTIGLFAVCVTAAAMADGVNVVSFEKTLVSKDPADVSAGLCAVPSETERLADARYFALCSAKMDKSVYDANTLLRSGESLSADSSMTLLKSTAEGGEIKPNKVERREQLEMPLFNENDITLLKSADGRIAGDSGNWFAGSDRAIMANQAEMSALKAPDVLKK